MTERDKLIQLLKNQNCPSPMLCSPECKYIDSADCHAERLADMLIENDVVGVIRCKDCKYANKSRDCFEFDCKTPLYECSFMRQPNRGHEYCSWGERMEAE